MLHIFACGVQVTSYDRDTKDRSARFQWIDTIGVQERRSKSVHFNGAEEAGLGCLYLRLR